MEAAPNGDSRFLLILLTEMNMTCRKILIACCVFFCGPAFSGNLGTMYEYGMSVAQDEGHSAEWFRRAADLGNPYSQFRLSIMYYQGEGVTRDRVEAAKWWNVAMSNGLDWERRFRPQIESAEAKLTEA